MQPHPGADDRPVSETSVPTPTPAPAPTPTPAPESSPAPAPDGVAAGGSDASDTWSPDILGPDFEQLTLRLGESGPATLVRYAPENEPVLDDVAAAADVIYVHGWSDYFFQAKFARFWHRHGARFHALDLHCYGRSLRLDQVPGYVTDQADYDADIEAALAAMNLGREGERPLILLGHSTGGTDPQLLGTPPPGPRVRSGAEQSVARVPGGGARSTRDRPALVQLQAHRHPLAPYSAVDAGIYSRSVSSASGERGHTIRSGGRTAASP